MFSRKHYNAMAEWIDVFDFSNPVEKKGFVAFLAAKFNADNPNFQREKWMKACGVE